MKTVFADSFYFFALVNHRDPAHARAVAFLQSYTGHMRTSDWILTEVADGLSEPLNRPAFVQTLELVRAEPHVYVTRFSEELFEAASIFFGSAPISTGL